MDFPKVEEALQACKEHLESTSSFNTEIESFLVQHMLVLICREYEITIEDLAEKRASKAGDPHLTKFVSSTTDIIFRSMKINEISGFLGKFGGDYKQEFTEFMKNNEDVHTSFDNIVVNRHTIAHKGGVQMTFGELYVSFDKSKSLLDKIASIFGV